MPPSFFKQNGETNMEPIEIFRLLESPAPQKIAYTGTAGNGTALADASKVTYVKVLCTTAAYIKIGNGLTATTTSRGTERIQESSNL